MKVLYAIQGTGNGHITVAREVLPLLMRRAEVDILVSGCQVDVGLPYEIKYRLHGLSFIFGKKGGIDYLETFRKSRIRELFREIRKLPVEEYDLVISDFEPVSAWACHLKNRTCIGFSHQAAVVNKRSPQPIKKDLIGRAVLKHYAPTTYAYGFHFIPYDQNIYTPVIRQEIRNQRPHNAGHYTVYLPSYGDRKISKILSAFPGVRWEVFSKHSNEIREDGLIHFKPIGHESFVESLAGCTGVLCNAGFQTAAEALYLKKKLMVVPMKGQFEQQCNAEALKLMGVPVIKSLKFRHSGKISAWLESEHSMVLDFPDDTGLILDDILETYKLNERLAHSRQYKINKFSQFRNLLLKNVFNQLGS